MLLIVILLLLIFGFGYGGYRVGPGMGYYGGGGLSLILTIVLILVLLKYSDRRRIRGSTQRRLVRSAQPAVFEPLGVPYSCASVRLAGASAGRLAFNFSYWTWRRSSSRSLRLSMLII